MTDELDKDRTTQFDTFDAFSAPAEDSRKTHFPFHAFPFSFRPRWIFSYAGEDKEGCWIERGEQRCEGRAGGRCFDYELCVVVCYEKGRAEEER